MTIARESPEERFKALRLTNTFLDTLKSFEELRNSLSINENGKQKLWDVQYFNIF